MLGLDIDGLMFLLKSEQRQLHKVNKSMRIVEAPTTDQRILGHEAGEFRSLQFSAPQAAATPVEMKTASAEGSVSTGGRSVWSVFGAAKKGAHLTQNK